MLTRFIPTRFQMLAKVSYSWPYLRAAAKLPPVPIPESGFAAEIHMLICKYHLLPAIAALKSFYAHSGLAGRVGLMFHLDSTMRPRHERVLRRHFPGASFVPFDSRDDRIEAILRDRPHCRRFYANLVMTLKLFQVAALCRSPRVILLDSDVFFFSRPEAIIHWVEGDPCVPLYLTSSRPASANPNYCQALRQLERELHLDGVSLDMRSDRSFNAGLLLFEPKRLCFDLIERFFAHESEKPNIHVGGWCAEQTAYLLNFASWSDAVALDLQDYALGERLGKVFSHFMSLNYYKRTTLRALGSALDALPSNGFSCA